MIIGGDWVMMHVQTWMEDEAVATLADWLMRGQGIEIASVSQLVRVALEMLVDVAVIGGWAPVRGQAEVERVFENIAQARSRQERGRRRKGEQVMPFVAKTHVQTMIEPQVLAVIQQWLEGRGENAVSMSDLVYKGLTALADAAIEAGVPPVASEEETEEILSRIGRVRKRAKRATGLALESSVVGMNESETRRQIEYIMKTKYGRGSVGQSDSESRMVRHALASSDGEILASEANDGEFSAEALREEER